MIKGELTLIQREDGGVQYRDDMTRFWCACGEPASHYFPDKKGHWEFECDECAEVENE
ncbi:hypothetical protein ACQKF0_29920 [Bacillus wiedmannii]|uniref:Uncharacterized protein n=1 Tax=Bacillus thuringiensis TaxID=1428 RepID=A0A9X5N9H9_BACTU|nr:MULTISPECIES: hypothetical protein [Bacillus]KAA1803366.1 hypothetical protein FXB61_005960 [Bacillus cereus]MDA2480726.1 hypothetical protein [Bacillus cereus]MDA2497774.1 hypothetical protein [Bacillus cereus]OFC94626.1 hypothetical protein BTGOE4_10160 [Bacillus thuringiensis]